MKELFNKLQKDLMKLQHTVQKESVDLADKVRTMIVKGQIGGKGKELEKLIEKKLTTFEPVFEALVKELTKNAKKTGIDLSKFEKDILSAKDALKKRVKKAKSASKKKASKKATKKKVSKAKATVTKKTVAKKKVSKKASTKG